MSTRLRLAKASDLDGLVALEALFPGDRLSRSGLRRFLRVPSAKVWVAVETGIVVGDAILLLRRGSTVARIYSVVVAPAARGQGLGDRLIAATEAAARKAGCTAIRLEVRSDNAAARALYARRGYLPLTVLPGYYEDGADGLRLQKSLRTRSASSY